MTASGLVVREGQGGRGSGRMVSPQAKICNSLVDAPPEALPHQVTLGTAISVGKSAGACGQPTGGANCWNFFMEVIGSFWSFCMRVSCRVIFRAGVVLLSFTTGANCWNIFKKVSGVLWW